MQTRDWNEELQTTRELPRKNLPERLLRERAIFKVTSHCRGGANRTNVIVLNGGKGQLNILVLIIQKKKLKCSFSPLVTIKDEKRMEGIWRELPRISG